MLPFQSRLIFLRVLMMIVSAASLFPASASPQDNSDFSEAPQLSEKRLQLVFDSAQGFIDRENYNSAFPLLQAILNQAQDAMIPIDPGNSTQSVSLKGEVLKTFQTLPSSARESYNLQYDAQARELLQESASVGAERRILEEIVRRFYYTETGFETGFRLANLYFDRGEYFSAGMIFERLLDDRRISRELIPRILFQTAICWHRSDLIEQAQESLARLKSIAQENGLVLAGERVKLFEHPSDAVAWLEQHAELSEDSNTNSRVRNWLTFRGDSSRNASSDPIMPLREKALEFRTIPLAESSDPRQLELVEQHLQELTEKLRNTSYLTFPAYHPLVIENRIIFRTLDNIKAIDMTTGEMLWENFHDDSELENLLESPLENFSLSESRISDVQKYVMQRSWRDLSSGQLSSDGEYIYAIENQGLVHGEYDLYGRAAQPQKNSENQLICYQVNNGKRIWGLGGSGTPFANSVFLGAPLVQGGEIYCLVEREHELRLLALRNRVLGPVSVVPDELWSQPLSISSANEESFGDPLRRISGLSPTYCNGMLICPTGRGTIISYDLAHRIFSWRFEYEDGPLHARSAINSLSQLRQHHGIGPEDESRWIDPTPVAAGSRLFVTPTDSDSLYCLDALNGKLLWSVPRGDDLYLACVVENSVVLVGREKIHALSSQDGQELWTVSIPRPSGRGYLADNRYFVPLSTAAIACIDLNQGELLVTVPSDYARVPGNLVAAGGKVVSLTADRLVRYETDIPPETESLARRYEMEGKRKLFQGELPSAIDLLLEAHELEPNSTRQGLLTELMLDAVRRNYSENARFIDRLVEFTRGTPQASDLEELLAEGFYQSGQPREAFALFLKIAHLPKKEIQRKHHRVRNDVWARAHLEDLYRSGSEEDRVVYDEILDMTIETVQDPVRSADLLKLIEGLPGREPLLLKRIDRIDPYTETLEFEQALIRLQHSSSPERRREGLAKHFKLLMKLDRTEQAAVLRKQLLSEYADVVCLDGQTGKDLAIWSEENQKLADYLRWRDYKWPQGPPRVAPFDSDSLLPRGLFTPIEGDAGIFRDWRFEYVSNNPRRLLGYGPFGTQKIELPVAYLNRSQYQLNYDRKIHVHGHLAVLEFFDHFFVFDLFQNGELSFLHGPHQLTQPLAGVETSSTKSGNTQSTTAPNGHPEVEVVDLFHQPFGEIGVVTEEAIVHQKGRWLIAIDSLTGEALWHRQLASRGQRLFGNRQVVSALPHDGQIVSQYRTLDGTPMGEYELGPIDRILSMNEDRLIVQSNLESHTQIACHDLTQRQLTWQTDCAAGSLFQTIDRTELAILGPSGRFRLLSLKDGSPRAEFQISSLQEAPRSPDDPPTTVDPAAVREAFWIHPFSDGWLLLLKESVDEKKQPSVRVSQFPDSVAVHGDVIFFDLDGQVRWKRRIERQGFSIAHPSSSPLIVLCARQLPVPGQFVRLPQNAMVQLLDLATGDPIGPQSNYFQNNGFQIVVSPAESRTEIHSSKNSYAVSYGPEDSPKKPE